MKPIKVVTFGRSSQNDVVLNDSKASRTHCQIIQYDNGSFAIADFGSTNGTFVNGVRINGQAPLNETDSVRVASTELFWQKYFATVKGKSAKSWLWPTIAASAGFVLLVLIAVLLFSSSSSGETFAFEGEYPNSVAVKLVDDDGTPYTIEAIDGQVCVWFNEGVSYKEAKKNIDGVGGKIVAQIPNVGYYLVQVSSSEVQDFLAKIKKVPGINHASPNMVSYPCMAHTYILDNYNPDMSKQDTTPHGLIVQYALQEYDTQSPFKPYNIGTNDGKRMCTSEKSGETCVNNAVFALNEIASTSVENGTIIINMSFGPYLRPRENGVRYYWISATDEEKEDYQIRFKKHIQNIIEIVKPLDGKDFIITKSAGNNGVKVFDSVIISYLENNLSTEEKEVLNKHFLLVTAGEKEKINKNYSNEMEQGRYHPWVTQVDISNFEYNGVKRRGTSYAAPRAAGFITLIANKYDIGGAEVLKYAREATRIHPKHMLTLEMLDSLVNADKNKKEVQTSEYVDLGLPSGTLWKSQNENGWYDYNQAVRQFGKSLPTKEQMEELVSRCRWTWVGNGYRVDGPNGRFIIMPVSGYRHYESEEGGVEFTALDEAGWYWTSTPEGSGNICFLKFFSNEIELSVSDRSEEFSVRLVKKITSNQSVSTPLPRQTPSRNNGLVGTKWRKDFSNNPNKEWYTVLDFIDESYVIAKEVVPDINAEDLIGKYHYYYDSESKVWCIPNWGKHEQYFIINGDKLQIAFYKNMVLIDPSSVFYRM